MPERDCGEHYGDDGERPNDWAPALSKESIRPSILEATQETVDTNDVSPSASGSVKRSELPRRFEEAQAPREEIYYVRRKRLPAHLRSQDQ